MSEPLPEVPTLPTWENLPSLATPVTADNLNDWGDGLRAVAQAARGYAEDALAHVDLLAAPAIEQVAGYIDGVGGEQVRVAGDARWARIIGPTPYTPVLHAATIAPTLGAGAITQGEYVRLGDWVQGWATVVFGTSGVNPGDGRYELDLPVPPADTSSVPTLGEAHLFSVTEWRTATSLPTSGGRAQFRATGNTGATVGATVPWTWAAQHQIRFTFAYKAAA